MSDFYDEMLETVQELLEEFGRDITLIKFGQDPAVVGKPWNDRDVSGDTSIVIRAAIVPPSATKNFGIQSLGSGVRQADLFAISEKIFIVEGPTDVTDYDQVLDNGEYYFIKVSQTLEPGDTLLLSYLGVRR